MDGLHSEAEKVRESLIDVTFVSRNTRNELKVLIDVAVFGSILNKKKLSLNLIKL